MRELFVFLFLLMGLNLFGQNQIFKGTESTNFSKEVINNYFTDYTIVDFKTDQLQKEVFKRDYEDVFILEFTKEYKWEIFLYENEIRTPDYKVFVQSEDGVFETAPSAVKTFKGILNDAKGERVSLTIGEDFIYGFITKDGVKYFIEPATYFDKKAKKDQFVIYSELDVIPSENNKCAATDLHNHSHTHDNDQYTTDRSSLACFEVDLAIASDFTMVQKYGSQNGVENHNIGVMNNVAADYDDNFDEEIKFKIVTQFYSICNSCDPWTNDRDAGTLLGSFRAWGQGGGFGVNFDLGQIWTNRDFNGGTIGIAYLTGNGTPCTTLKYHAIQDFSTNASLIRVVVSHEIGHNFASGHDGGGGFIMSPFVNNTNVWSPNSQNAINNTIFGKVANGCFTACSIAPPPDDPTVFPLEAVITKNDETCFGFEDGEFCVNVTGGVEPYNIFWSVFGNTGECFSDLAPGNYACTIVDALFNSIELNDLEILGSSADLELELLEIIPDDCDPTDFFFSGGISVDAFGGTEPYQYGWTNNHLDASPPNMATGEYFVTVFDGFGCEQTFGPWFIPAGDSPDVAAAASNMIDCSNNTAVLDGTGSATGSDFSYLWTTTDGNIVSGADALMATIDQVGNYILTITNNESGCSNTASVEITGNTEDLIVEINSPDHLDCENSSTSLSGDATMTSDDNTYSWEATNGGNILSGGNSSAPTIDEAGTYTLTVTNTITGCTGASSVEVVDNTEDLQVSFDHPGDLTCLTQTIPFSVTVSATNASFEWTTPSGTTNIFVNENTLDLTEVGNYTLLVTNLENGCTFSTTIPVNENVSMPTSEAGESALLGCKTNTIILNGNGSSSGSDFTYQWTSADGNILSDGSTLNPEIDEAGTYVLVVTDASNGCTASSSVIVTEDFTAPEPSLSADDALDCNSTSLNITAQDLANLDVSYVWSTQNGQITSGANTNEIEINGAGTYQVEITNLANGCSATESITLNSNMSNPTAFAGTAVVINCLNTTAVLDGSGSSVGNNFTYQWTGSGIVSGGNDLNPVVDQSGSYEIIVKDNSNGCTASSTVEVTVDLTEPTANAGPGSLLGCNTDLITLDATASSIGNEYSYTWSGPGIQSGGNTLTPDVNQAGVYMLTVVNSTNGCEASSSVEITADMNLPIADAGQNNLIGCGQTSILLGEGNTSSGAEFTYSWSTLDGTIISTPNAVLVEVEAAGTYTLIVQNTNNGCSSTASITVEQISDLETNIAQLTQVSCSGAADATAMVSVMNGSGSFTYEWSNGDNTSTSSNLSAGTYTVLISDASGCSATETITIQEPTAMIDNGTFSNIDMFEADNGSVTLNVSGGTIPYTYNWSNGATTAEINGLAPGTYSVEITDANGCILNRTFEIQSFDCDLIVELESTDVLCFGGATGEVIAVVSNQPNTTETFEWTDANGNVISNESTVSNLSAGTYNIAVNDSDGCRFVSMIEVFQPEALDLTLNDTQLSGVGADDGSISTMVEGGTMPYSYEWFLDGNILQETGSSISNLAVGEYLVLITDANGCITQLSVTIEGINCNLETSILGQNVSCFGAANGSASVITTLGVEPFTYAWSNEMSTSTISDVEAGSYTVSVTDALGCVATTSIVIDQPDALSFESSVVDIACNGDSNGSFSINIEGGTEPYSIDWENGFTDLNESDVSAGAYSGLVTDANGCEINVEIEITEPDALALTTNFTDISLNGAMDGTISISPEGGTEPYTYLWNNGEITSTIMNLDAGSYEVMVSDANGCIQTATFLLSEPSLLSASTEVTNVVCFGETNGAAFITIASGTEPFSYLWDNGTTESSIQEVPAGTYSVEITDATGASITLEVVITEPDDIVTSAVSTSVTCDGDVDGTASISATGGVEPYEYNWDNAFIGAEQSGLAAAAYQVTVIDANNCEAIHIIVVDSPEPIGNDLEIIDVSCFGESDGSIAVESITGGTAPYSVMWSNGVEGNVIDGLEPGAFEVSITDNSGCVRTQFIVINEPEVLIIDLEELINVSAAGEMDGSIDVSISGGVGPYVYNWSNGATTEDLANLESGSYELEVIDANGCVILSEVYEVTMPTSNQELHLVESIRLSPNPSPGLIRLDLELIQEQEMNIGFYDISGKLVIPTMNFTSKFISQTFDLSGQTSGIYLVKIQLRDGVYVDKVSIVH